MAKQQISKQAKSASKAGSGAATRTARAGERQTRRRGARASLGTTEAQLGASATSSTRLAGVADNTATSTTDNEPTMRAASPSRAKPKRAAAAAKGEVRPAASTKRAMLIGMLERAAGASVAEIGQRLGWLPHTVRAAITGLRHAGREVTRHKDQSGRSVYKLAPVETADR
jgi:hypothetical protein